jgi:hypothetical protein
MILFSLLALVLLAAVPAGAAPLADPCVAGQGYSPACDVDQDGDVDVLDIQLTAGRWGASGAYVADGWSLTGNAGTTPGTNFLGTTDNVALEIRVNGSRALLIQPNNWGSHNIVGGHTLNGASPGVFGATISGGGGGGYSNWVYDNHGTVGGGTGNVAGSNDGNMQDALAATVSGGSRNTSSDAFAAVGGGWQNTASGAYAAVGGGSQNEASGYYAAVPGGSNNLASGNYSFAAGRRAKAGNPGAFVLADSNDFDFAPGVNNAFTARFTGGARFILGIDGTGASTWQCTVYNGGSWGCSSDRNLKENFEPVDGRAILEKLAALPITTWNAIGTDPSVRRMGPMAQDFYAAFGLGDDDKVITTGDLDGVALASIQGLYRLVQEKDAQLAAQQAQIDALTARLITLEQGASTAP